MIVGAIDPNLDARIELEIVIECERKKVECVLDTGFNGFLSLPMPLVNKLGLKLGAVQSGITADGKSGYFDTVRTTILWLDEEKSFQAQVLDEALIGTRLLRGLRMEADWISNGVLRLQRLQP